MIITYKRKLKLNSSQRNRVDSWIGACRIVYNLGLEIKIDAYKKHNKSIHKFELMKQLPELKKDVDWIKDVPCHTLQNVLERLDNAYKKFFSGGGFPKWASKYKYSSILFKSVKVKGNLIKLPKLGFIKSFKDRPIIGQLKTATITREPDGYYISITAEIDKPLKDLPSESQAVGIDVGISKLISLSNGESIDNPKHFKKYERQLRIENRRLSRKKRYSKNWYKQKKRLTRLHSKIARVRKDFLHKLSWNIIKDYGVIALEKLNIKAMSRSNLAKHILDAGWSMFINFLEYKAKWYNRIITKVDPKYTSQTCSSCGYIHKENRKSQDKFSCLSCGHEENADINAAKNILARAMANVSQREALACA